MTNVATAPSTPNPGQLPLSLPTTGPAAKMSRFFHAGDSDSSSSDEEEFDINEEEQSEEGQLGPWVAWDAETAHGLADRFPCLLFLFA